MNTRSQPLPNNQARHARAKGAVIGAIKTATEFLSTSHAEVNQCLYCGRNEWCAMG
jgi:hypothetical protein